MVKLRMWCETGSGDLEDFVEIPDRKWNAMAPAAQQKKMSESLSDHLENCINSGCEVVDETAEPSGGDS